MRSLDSVHANAAAADDHDSASWYDLRAMDDCPNASRYTTTNKYRFVEWVVVFNLDNRHIGNNAAFAKGGDDAHLANILTFRIVHTEGSIKLGTHQNSGSHVTEVGMATCAVIAGPT